jgi:hypothetical protein
MTQWRELFTPSAPPWFFALVLIALAVSCSTSPKQLDGDEDNRGALLEEVVFRIDDPRVARWTVVSAAKAQFDGLPGRSSGEMWEVDLTLREGEQLIEASAERALIDTDGEFTLQGAEVTAGRAGELHFRVEELRASTGRSGFSGSGVHARFDLR